jgi:hypothetical protein
VRRGLLGRSGRDAAVNERLEPLPGSWCREGESNPHRAFAPADFKSAASANFAIPARDHFSLTGMGVIPPIDGEAVIDGEGVKMKEWADSQKIRMRS